MASFGERSVSELDGARPRPGGFFQCLAGGFELPPLAKGRTALNQKERLGDVVVRHSVRDVDISAHRPASVRSSASHTAATVVGSRLSTTAMAWFRFPAACSSSATNSPFTRSRRDGRGGPHPGAG